MSQSALCDYYKNALLVQDNRMINFNQTNIIHPNGDAQVNDEPKAERIITGDAVYHHSNHGATLYSVQQVNQAYSDLHREFERLQLHLPMILNHEQAELLDICPSGMQIETHGKLSLHELLNIKSELLDGIGEIRYTLNCSGDRLIAGIKFIDAHFKHRLFINVLV